MHASVPSEITERLERELKFRVTGFSFTSGGCINKGGKLETDSGIFFLKWNDATAYPGMFKAESKGLQLLGEAKAIRIPNVVYAGESERFQFLLMEFISATMAAPRYWETFGLQLAALHQHTADSFGLDHDNYIGSLRQSNKRYLNGIEFFVNERIDVQARLAVNEGHLAGQIIGQLEKLTLKLHDLLPAEKPALLHGDLWSGNLMVDEKGNPCLIDPAIYYGFREMDLAMTMLFGGFDRSYLNAYNGVIPLEKGFNERINIYQLYPVLVHVNLFGKSYVPQVVSILNRFV